MFKYFFLLAFSIVFGKYVFFQGNIVDIGVMALCGILSFISDIYLIKSRQDAALQKLFDLVEIVKGEVVNHQEEQNQLKSDVQKLNSAISVTKLTQQNFTRKF